METNNVPLKRDKKKIKFSVIMCEFVVSMSAINNRRAPALQLCALFRRNYRQSHENLQHIAIAASQKIGVQLAEADIEDVVRVGPKTRRQSKSPSSPRPPRPIVLKLLRRRKTEELLKAAKARRNLTTEKLVDGNPTPIFFNERLTHYNRQLFREARKRSKENQFQYCWIKNGGIYVRKSDGMAAMRIRTAAELDEKVGPASQHADVENITL
ncbi:hypothetical protein ACJJTC_003780 [Scirpophaga incertulas]